MVRAASPVKVYAPGGRPTIVSPHRAAGSMILRVETIPTPYRSPAPMCHALMSARMSHPEVFAVLTMLGMALMVHAELPEVSRLPSQPDLPDPLVMFNGERITSKEQWVNQRRPELKELFQYYMYGYLPAAPEKVEYKR